jgi:hypothetical protein
VHNGAFLAFLRRNAGVRELSLNDSIFAGSLSLIQGIAGLRGLTHFSIAIVDTAPCELPLRPPLMRLMQNNEIAFLDVSGQPIQEATIFAIINAAHNLCGFRFDRTALSSCEALNAVCRRVLAKEGLRFSAFPAGELVPALTRSPILSRIRLEREATQLRSQFRAKFGSCRGANGVVASARFGEFVEHAGEVIPIEPIGRDDRIEWAAERVPPMAENFAEMADFVEYPQAVMELLAMCGDVPGVDPLAKAFAEIEAAIDVRVLAEQLPMAV